MTWALIRKELLTNLLTYRLAVALIFTVTLSALTTFIGSVDFSTNMDAYRTEVRSQAEELEQATVYEQTQQRVILPPQPLAIFSRGLTGLVPQNYWVGLDYVGRAPWAMNQGSLNPYMKALGQIDFVTVVTLLLSFLAVVLGYDGICGERERGTLKVMLTNPVPRAQVVLGKLVGGVISLWIPLTMAFLVCLLIVLANGDVAFSAGDWARVGVLFGVTCLFLAQVFALSLLVSTLVRDSDTSLIICLFFWLVGGVGYITALPSLSRYGHEEKPHQDYMNQNRELWNAFGRHMEEWEAAHPQPSEVFFQGLNQDGVRRFYHPEAYRWWEQRQAVELDKILEVADQSYKARFAAWDPLAQEGYFVDIWSVLSPFTNYQVLAYQVARTTLDDLFSIGRASRDYRQTWIEYLRSKNALSSRRWFTDDPPDQEPMIPDPDSLLPTDLATDSAYMVARRAWAQEQLALASDDDRRRLDLSDMPKFGGAWQRTLGETFSAMSAGLVVLLLSFGVSVLGATLRFMRYDPS
jgi:ABC-type transport system involved in multi-copper enzyme maturation permease subunit